MAAQPPKSYNTKPSDHSGVQSNENRSTPRQVVSPTASDLAKDRLNGLAITRLRETDQDVPGFVLVHGAMDRASSMRRLAKALAPFPVTIYDRRGYAGSLEKSGSVDAEDVSGRNHVEDLKLLVKERPTVVFGHSMGGTIALMMAAKSAPANLLGLVIFEAPLPAEPWWPSWLAKPKEFFAELDPAHVERRAEAFMRRMIGEENWRRLPSSTQASRRLEGFTMIKEGASLAGFESAFSTRAIRHPTTSSLGQFGSFRHRLGQLHMEKTINDLRSTCIVGSGHGAHLSHPRAVAELCVDLMAEVAPNFHAILAELHMSRRDDNC